MASRSTTQTTQSDGSSLSDASSFDSEWGTWERFVRQSKYTAYAFFFRIHSSKELDTAAFVILILSILQFFTFNFPPFFAVALGEDAHTNLFAYIDTVRTFGSGRYSYSIQQLLFSIIIIVLSNTALVAFFIYRSLNTEVEWGRNKKLEFMYLFLRVWVPLLYVPMLINFLTFFQCNKTTGNLYATLIVLSCG